uniref:Uncharacterized protein n=1 Tax=Oryza glaberrima TaxID=4538 RepID=I1PT48_ORYGL
GRREVSVSVSPTKKRKGECSALDGGEDALAPPAKKKKMWLLPQEEVDWILAQSNEPVPTEFRELKRANPSLEEEAKFAKFQAWVRGEYARKGFVEVDYDYFGERAEVFRLNDEAREEVMGHWDHPSDTDDDDDEDWKLFIREIRRTFV